MVVWAHANLDGWVSPRYPSEERVVHGNPVITNPEKPNPEFHFITKPSRIKRIQNVTLSSPKWFVITGLLCTYLPTDALRRGLQTLESSNATASFFPQKRLEFQAASMIKHTEFERGRRRFWSHIHIHANLPPSLVGLLMFPPSLFFLLVR